MMTLVDLPVLMSPSNSVGELVLGSWSVFLLDMRGSAALTPRPTYPEKFT